MVDPFVVSFSAPCTGVSLPNEDKPLPATESILRTHSVPLDCDINLCQHKRKSAIRIEDDI